MQSTTVTICRLATVPGLIYKIDRQELNVTI